jgi:hypothetical protein
MQAAIRVSQVLSFLIQLFVGGFLLFWAAIGLGLLFGTAGGHAILGLIAIVVGIWLLFKFDVLAW